MQLTKTLFSAALAITSVLGTLSAAPLATAQRAHRCYQVSDPDGWSNLRERHSQTVVARVDSGQVLPVSSIRGDTALLAYPHSSFTIHRSRLTPASSSHRCPKFTAVESDGYLNLRTSPNGEIIDQIYNGTPLLILSEGEQKYG